MQGSLCATPPGLKFPPDSRRGVTALLSPLQPPRAWDHVSSLSFKRPHCQVKEGGDAAAFSAHQERGWPPAFLGVPRGACHVRPSAAMDGGVVNSLPVSLKTEGGRVWLFFSFHWKYSCLLPGLFWVALPATATSRLALGGFHCH